MYPWCPDCEGRGALPCTVCVGGHADCERCEGTDMETCALCERLSVLFGGERVRDVVAMAKELVSLRHDAKARRLVVTTGGTYLGSVDFDAALRQLEIERDEARRERDKARAEASTLRQALKDYYHECTCNRSAMAAVHLAARLALSATEDKT